MLYGTVEMYENLPHFLYCITKYKKQTKYELTINFKHKKLVKFIFEDIVFT